MTHVRSDPDSLAGVIWGVKIFGGCSFVHEPDVASRNLMKALNFRPRRCKDFKSVFAYDAERPEKLPCLPENLVVFDHHPRNYFKNVRLIWRPRASLSMNLYDISIEAGFKLDDEVLLAFAAALVTDTAFLRTASTDELQYLGKFLNGRKLEDIFKIVLGGRVDIEGFIADLMTVKTDGIICSGVFSSDDHFVFFVDSLMYALECEVIVGLLSWGVWVFSSKSHVQKVFSALKKIDQMGFKRRVGKIYGLRNPDLVIDLIKEALS